MEGILTSIQSILFASALNGLLLAASARLASVIGARRGASDLSDMANGGNEAAVENGTARSGRAPFTPVDRIVMMLACWALGVLTVIIPLGAAGLLSRWTAIVGAGVLAAAVAVVTRRSPKDSFGDRLAAGVVSASRSDRLAVIAGIPGLAALTMLLAWAAFRPSYGFDPLNYHLPLAAAVFRSGSFAPVHFPPYFETFPYFTMHGDLFSVWAMLSTGDTSLLPLANLPLYVLLAAALYSFLREMVPTRAVAVAITSALLTVPAFFVLLTDAYVEIPLWAFMFASTRLAVLSGRAGHERVLFVLSAMACGAMAGTKLTGIPMAAVPIAAWILATPAMQKGRAAIRLSAFAAIAFAVGGYFYVRNLVVVGSPVYPFPFSIGGVTIFDGDAEHAARVGGTTIRRFLAPLVLSGELFKAFVGTREPPNSSWGMGVTGPVFLAAGWAALVHVFRPLYATMPAKRSAGDRSVRLGPIFVMASVLAVFIYINLPWCAPYLYGNVRFVYPAVPFAALALASTGFFARIGRTAAVVAILVVQAASFAFASVPFTLTGVVAVAAMAAIIVAFVLLSGRPHFVRYLRPAFLAAVVSALSAVVIFRIEPVAAYKDAGFTSGPIRWASERADCLAALENEVPAGPFALTMARGAPHAWFIFPLLGERMQRVPVYVDISRDGAGGALKSADSLPGYPGADREFWLAGVLKSGVPAIMVLNDEEDVAVGRSPVESGWIDSNPDRFEPVYQGRFCALYRIKK